MSRNKVISSLALLGASLSYAAPAFAYLDPGTGSIILQGIIATVAGMLVAGRLYWQRVKAFFAGLVSGDKSAENASAASSMDADAADLAGSDE